MKKRLVRALTGVGLLALVAGGLTLGLAGVAAAATPPWQTPTPPAAELGGLLFFNAAGQQITGGSTTTAPFAAYVEGTAVLNAGDSKATLEIRTPVAGENPGLWTGEAIGGSPTYPNTSAPAPLNTSTDPVYTGAGTDNTLETYSTTVQPNTNTTSGYEGLYELRLVTSDPTTTTTYDAADISITSTNNTWSVVYPAVTLTSTTTTLTATPASPQVQGANVTLTAAVSPSAPGTVQFEVGTTDIGTPQTVTDGTASITTTSLPIGSPDSLSAVFTPAQYSAYSGLTGTASYTITAPALPATTTALTVNPTTAAAYTAVSLSAAVTNSATSAALAAGAGTVAFYDNGTSTSDTVTSASTLLGTEPLVTGGLASLSWSSFAEGAHNLVAEFLPAAPAGYLSSTSAVVLFTATAPTYTPDQQGVEVNIPAGTLTITTPYTPTNPFNLGTATLNAGQGYFSATAPFGSSTNPSQGVTITDTGIGENTWTASVTATNFTGPDSDVINAQNLSFTSVTPSYITGNLYGTGTGDIPVVTTPVNSASWSGTTPTGVVYASTASGSDGLSGGPHAFADTATAGGGSVYVYGNLNLVAPSSVTPGLYTATLTFTIA